MSGSACKRTVAGNGTSGTEIEKGLRGCVSQPFFERLAAAVVVSAATAIVASTSAAVVTTAAEQDDNEDDDPRASATKATAKAIVTHNCLPPFGLQYIILHRHKTCYKFLFSNFYKKELKSFFY